MKRLLRHIGFDELVSDPINVFCDNQSATELSKNAVYHKRSKNIDIKLHFTRELVERGEIVVRYLRTELMIADVFTKALPNIKHQRCCVMLNLK